MSIPFRKCNMCVWLCLSFQYVTATFVISVAWTVEFLLPAYIICCSGLHPVERKWILDPSRLVTDFFNCTSPANNEFYKPDLGNWAYTPYAVLKMQIAASEDNVWVLLSFLVSQSSVHQLICDGIKCVLYFFLCIMLMCFCTVNLREH